MEVAWPDTSEDWGLTEASDQAACLSPRHAYAPLATFRGINNVN